MPPKTNKKDPEGLEVPMDELKMKKVMNEKMKKLVKGGLKLLKLVQNHPDLWSEDIMKEYRDLSYKITGNPDKFQPEVKGGWGSSPEDLTKDIGGQLYDRALPILKLGSNIMLQITHAESEWKSNQIDNSTVPSQQWRFNAVDGDGTSIPLRVDTTLTSAANVLTPGAVVLIESFIPIHFKYDDHQDERCAIVIKKFELKGHHPLSDDLLKRPTKRAKISKEIKQAKKKAIARREHHPTEKSINPGCKCQGELCSQHGVEFVVCLTECVPVESVSLPMVARECVFANKDVEMMSQSEKRFLLYYYFATTVYQFRGKGNRVELPECLKLAVRALYPNDQEVEIGAENY
ncbi:hypothetical protein ACHAXR_001827 [Thalassiosira sp. AJA248-18]